MTPAANRFFGTIYFQYNSRRLRASIACAVVCIPIKGRALRRTVASGCLCFHLRLAWAAVSARWMRGVQR